MRLNNLEFPTVIVLLAYINLPVTVLFFKKSLLKMQLKANYI